MGMTPDTFTVIGTGIALAALNIGLFAWLRSDVQELRQEVHRHGHQIGSLRERIAKLAGHLEGLRERMVKLEGHLERLGEAIAERRAG